jgi:hypothetical protein
MLTFYFYNQKCIRGFGGESSRPRSDSLNLEGRFRKSGRGKEIRKNLKSHRTGLNPIKSKLDV